MWSIKLLCSMKTLWPILVLYKSVLCNPIVKTLSDNIREYTVKEENDQNVTDDAVTLQKEGFRHTVFVPAQNVIQYKEVSDNTLSGSSYSRGLLHHDHAGIPPHTFEEHPHIPQFGYESYHYHLPEEHQHHIAFQDHGHHHHGGHHHHLGFGHGHRHKHLAYDIATKAVLWPLAGLAFLGAAAALVTNPVLLQLGVVSGKRRRRDTEEVTGPNNAFDYLNPVEFKRVSEKLGDNFRRETGSMKGDDRIRSTTMSSQRVSKKLFKRRLKEAKQRVLLKRRPTTAQSTIESVTLDASQHNRYLDDDGFVPIPLKSKTN